MTLTYLSKHVYDFLSEWG